MVTVVVTARHRGERSGKGADTGVKGERVRGLGLEMLAFDLHRLVQHFTALVDLYEQIGDNSVKNPVESFYLSK